MNLDEIDRALAEWKVRLSRIDENLIALETDPAYTLLEQAGDSGLEGVTRARVGPALAAMRELFGQRGLLDDVLERAAHVRAGINRLWAGDGPKEVERLLRGPSIALPPVETPLARRGLLDAAATDRSVTPDQLVAAMVASFEQARDAVAAVSAVWDRLTPAAERAAAALDDLDRRSAELGEDLNAPIAAARSQLEKVRAAIARDPLGASDTLAEGVETRLHQLDDRLAALEIHRSQVSADLRRAHALLETLRQSHARAVASHGACQREITPTVSRPEPVEESRIEGLAGWLRTLDGTVSAGRWPSAGVGLTRWLAAAQQALDADAAVEAGDNLALHGREELKGRLAARRQQARTLAARGAALDPDLEALAARADELLSRTPCPLEEAAAALSDYEGRLVPHRSGGK